MNLFKLSDPEENRGNQVTARELLDSGAKRLRAGLKNQPETKAALLSTVGAVYDSLGQYQDALPILNESLTLQPQSHDKSRIDTLLELGHARIGAGDLSGAEQPSAGGAASCRRTISAQPARNRDAPCGHWAGCGSSKANSPRPRIYTTAP